MNYQQKLIKISNLKINPENPRFEAVENQREAINSIVENQKDKLLRLANDILEHGLNPADLVIVTPDIEDKNIFLVLEGNRRVTTLKILNNPNLVPSTLVSLGNRFKKLADKFNDNPIFQISCIVFENEGEAMKWIKLKHTGENDGVGTVSWDAQQKARYEERAEGKASYALQIIEHLRNDEDFDQELKSKLPQLRSSNLQRLLTDPQVRKAIGINVKEGKITTNHSADEIRKPLARIVQDLTSDGFTVKEIYYKEDREKYIEKFQSSELPNLKNELEEWELDGKTYKKNSSSATNKTDDKKQKTLPLSTNRKN